MIIVNGLTRSLVVFGNVSHNDFQLFMAQMQHAVNLHKGDDPA
ncbi:hypothetial protein [Roseovarius Plymouth podovirus 1]|uniref:Hypothetial protein n=2 Tax=Roseovarius Plymouth podovirus 1 TaxID=926474 RepID=K4Q517_9CAUD|nr:hypothetical protein HYO70_gp10 [Roseovarius Plymouth podovirus 1]CBW47003.1 hypothetical protein [Roseovarius sp. 217 phage 1]CBX87940.1 hypothetial protein [Roseovarius Plymouth podovirus 1]